jgi:hypothetical protein
VIAIEKRRADLWGLDSARNVVEVVGSQGGPIQTDVGALLIERLRSLTEGSSENVASLSNVLDVEPTEGD